VNGPQGGDVGDTRASAQVEVVKGPQGGDVGDTRASGQMQGVQGFEHGNVGEPGASHYAEGVDGGEWREVGWELAVVEDERVVSTDGGRESTEWAGQGTLVFHGGPVQGMKATDRFWWTVERTQNGIEVREGETEVLDVARAEMGGDEQPEFDGEVTHCGRGVVRKGSSEAVMRNKE
jgi:hypothetical protein